MSSKTGKRIPSKSREEKLEAELKYSQQQFAKLINFFKEIDFWHAEYIKRKFKLESHDNKESMSLAYCNIFKYFFPSKDYRYLIADVHYIIHLYLRYAGGRLIQQYDTVFPIITHKTHAFRAKTGFGIEISTSNTIDFKNNFLEMTGKPGGWEQIPSNILDTVYLLAFYTAKYGYYPIYLVRPVSFAKIGETKPSDKQFSSLVQTPPIPVFDPAIFFQPILCFNFPANHNNPYQTIPLYNEIQTKHYALWRTMRTLTAWLLWSENESNASAQIALGSDMLKTNWFDIGLQSLHSPELFVNTKRSHLFQAYYQAAKVLALIIEYSLYDANNHKQLSKSWNHADFLMARKNLFYSNIDNSVEDKKTTEQQKETLSPTFGRAIALHLWDIDHKKGENYKKAVDKLFMQYETDFDQMSSSYMVKPSFERIIADFYTTTKHAILKETLFPVHYGDHISSGYNYLKDNDELTEPGGHVKNGHVKNGHVKNGHVKNGHVKSQLIYSEYSTLHLLEEAKEKGNIGLFSCED